MIGGGLFSAAGLLLVLAGGGLLVAPGLTRRVLRVAGLPAQGGRFDRVAAWLLILLGLAVAALGRLAR